MIEEPPILTIRRNFRRPKPEQVAAFAGAQTGHVVDALGGRAALDNRICPVDPSTAGFCGVAVPCDAGPGDILAICAALDIARKGDVIVAATDNFQGMAAIGDMLLGMMRNRGVVAFVTDGCVRDIKGIRAVGLPCFSSGVTPDSPNCAGPGTAGLPVTLGGRAVDAGDIVVGDADGVVVVPFERIDETIAQLARVRAAEVALETQVVAGLDNLPSALAIVRGSQVKEID